MQRPAPVVRRGLCARLPACGEGAIAKALAASGHNAVSADRYAYRFVQAGIGFLAGRPESVLPSRRFPPCASAIGSLSDATFTPSRKARKPPNSTEAVARFARRRPCEFVRRQAPVKGIPA